MERSPGLILVEDDDSIRRALQLALEDRGYWVVTAVDADTAAAALDVNDNLTPEATPTVEKARAVVVDRLPNKTHERVLAAAEKLGMVAAVFTADQDSDDYPPDTAVFIKPDLDGLVEYIDDELESQVA